MKANRFNPVFSGLGTTIFTIMSSLAVEYDAINLGQGFPDEDGPEAIREAAAQALRNGPNQYPPMQGLLELRRAIAEHSLGFYGLEFEPTTEVVVTSGATEALGDCIMGLVAPGDEAVVIEPCYDSYRPMLHAMGANIRTVRLSPPDFRITEDALAAAFSPATKVILVNSPLNPAGRVLDRVELELMAQFVQRFDAYAICDEVYEHLVFDGREHIPLITLPGMRERCVRIGSAGKMFSLTGWKIGWICGPRHLIEVITKAHQFNTFTTSPALQFGVVEALRRHMEFTLSNTRALEQRRDQIAGALRSANFDVLNSEGTYFITASIRNLTNEPDFEFCQRITREAGVAAVPLSVFYSDNPPHDLVRFAFCKKPATIIESGRRLTRYFADLAG